MIRVAINGFGRIGRLAFREIVTNNIFDLVAINDLTDAEELSYLVRYDSIHRSFHEEDITFDENNIILGGRKKIQVFNEQNPEKLPWKDLNIDLVLECTGAFTYLEDVKKHITAGAKKVLISAPGKGDMKTIVFGVNDDILDGSEQVVSSSSCTTNCLAPLLKVINDNFGIEKGFMTTVHAVTNDQVTLDIHHKKGYQSRRGRSSFSNIIPATTGAAASIGLVIPDLKGKMDGIAYRVPVSDGSLIDVTLELSKNVSIEEINKVLFDNESETLKVSKDPLVSSDVIGKKCGPLVDTLLTKKVSNGNSSMYKLVAWYDNELGYTSQMLKVAEKMCYYSQSK